MAGPRRDPYAILGMPRAASRNEIAAAYRRLAKAIHPDVASGASPDMRDLNWAWHVLSDTTRRASWDAAHPISSGHWRSVQTATASQSPANDAEMAAPLWSGGAGWTADPDTPGRRSAFGCIGLMVLLVLVVGLVLIAALYPTVPGSLNDPGDREAQVTTAP